MKRVLAAKDAIGEFPSAASEEGSTYWLSVYEKLLAMSKHGTSDGKPWVEPLLTDEDAKQRPWVMVRDLEDDLWQGPCIYCRKTAARLYAVELANTAVICYAQCRFATAEEIAAAEHTQEETQ
jgi:hypothetical protein